jgi:hypothetical protein
MKRINIFYCISLCLLLLIGSSCQNDKAQKPDQAKVDSLTKSDEERLKFKEDSFNRLINSMPDSDIVNDPNSPVRMKNEE